MEEDGQFHHLSALPLRNNSGAHCVGAWVGPRVGPDGFGEEKIGLFSSFLFIVWCCDLDQTRQP